MSKATLMTDFFKKANSLEETIPRAWLTDDVKTPPKKKRKPGRPRKMDKVCDDSAVDDLNTLSTTEMDSIDLQSTEDASSKTSASEPVVENVTAETDGISMPGNSQLAEDIVSETESIDSQLTEDAGPEDASSVSPHIRGKYKHYSHAEKLKIADAARQIGIRPAAKKFKVPVATLQGWKNLSKEKLPSKRVRGVGGGRKLTYPAELDDEIMSWFLQQRDQHIPVSQEMVMAKARLMVKNSNENFLGSRGWLQKFMNRHNLAMRRASYSQRLPQDLELKIDDFHKYLRQTRTEVDYDFVINMDETPAYFDMSPSSTIETKGNKIIKIRTTGGEKRHFTVVLAVSSDGRVLPTMAIFKGIRYPKDIEIPQNVQFRLQFKGWMNEQLMLDWIKSPPG